MIRRNKKILLILVRILLLGNKYYKKFISISSKIKYIIVDYNKLIKINN